MTTPQSLLSLTGLTQSNAIIQADRPILLRGDAAPHALIHIQLASHQTQTTADARGHWRAILPPLPAPGPYSGQVQSGSQTIPIQNLQAGQLWLCAGQSNMAMAVGFLVPEEVPPVDPQDPLRFVQILSDVSAVPLATAPMVWKQPTHHLKSASGVGYHFASRLHAKLQTPIGFVQAAIGHTPAMAWTPRDHIAPGSTAAARLQQFDKDLQTHPDAVENLRAHRKALQALQVGWDKQISAWQPAARALLAQGKPYPPMPPRATGLGDPHTPTVLYNAMIAPLAGEPIAGILWYQGESDAILGLADEYAQSLSSVIAGLRAAFGHVPVVIVQLPRHYDIQCAHPDNDWPTVRQAQHQVFAQTPDVGLVPTLDLGDTDRIHPIKKRTLAHRAADIAIALAYPDHSPVQPPRRHGTFSQGKCRGSMTDMDNHQTLLLDISIFFTDNLTHIPSDAPNAATFQVLTPSGWETVPHQLVKPNTIRLSTQSPVRSIRYAWAGDPIPVYFDSAGLPLPPFQTDFSNPALDPTP